MKHIRTITLFVICAFLLAVSLMTSYHPARAQETPPPLTLTATAAAPVQAPGEPLPVPDITAASLVIILAGVLALTADYFPGVAAWYDTLVISKKRLVMVAGAVLIVAFVFGGQCAGLLKTNLQCTPSGVVDILSNILLAFAVGQGVHIGAQPTPQFKKEVLDIDPKLANGKTP